MIVQTTKSKIELKINGVKWSEGCVCVCVGNEGGEPLKCQHQNFCQLPISLFLKLNI